MSSRGEGFPRDPSDSGRPPADRSNSGPPPRGTELASSLGVVVITDAHLAGERGVVETVRLSLEGGCRAVQYRDKQASPKAGLAVASELRRITAEAGALLFVNDRADVALEVGADGVHLGPEDLPVDAVRRWVGPDLLIGYSTDDPTEALRAVERGADYLGCGAVFGTSTKDVGQEAIGPSGLERVARAVPVPVVGIGGITPGNVGSLANTGASGVAVVGAVMTASDPRPVVAELLAAFRPR